MRRFCAFLAFLSGLGLSLRAQVPQDSLLVEDDFTFSEQQLDDESEGDQTVSALSNARDAYLSNVGYAFSAMRFKVRAYDNMYQNNYINGVMLNDMESGRFSYSLIGGMNDATRNRESVWASDFNTFGVTGVGGGQNINARAGDFAQGSKFVVTGCNRNYTLRTMFTHATGFNKHGWAFAGSVGYRWANYNTAYIDGTFYNSFSYFLAAQKRFNEEHSLNLVTFGAPTERAQQSAATEEVYWLANSHYYNSNWGYQAGNVRSAKIVHDYQPTAILTWDFTPDRNKKLTTSAAFKYSMYSNSALGWSGDAYDPRPDYYKNLPSSIFNVYDETKNNHDYLAENPYLLTGWTSLYNMWTSDEANRQINWDRMYYVNQQNSLYGTGESLYYLERRHNDQMVFALNSVWNHTLNNMHKYAVGLEINSTKGMHYKTMDDLLGGATFTDVDKFAVNDYGPDSQEAQNDLKNPNRKIGKGDIFGYNYNIYVSRMKAWTQYQLSLSKFSLNASAHLDGTMMEREGLMQNGRYVDNSLGKSGKAKFLGGGGLVRLVWSPSGAHHLSVSGSWDSQAPNARTAFVAPREQNNYVNNLKVENVASAELTYIGQFGPVTMRIGGFYTKFMRGVEQTAFYNDQESRFTYLTMTDVERQHYGGEFYLNWQVTSSFSLHFMGNVSEAQYVNNPYAQVNYNGMNATINKQLNTFVNPATEQEEPLRVIADGMHVSGTPLTALQLGAKYNINGWFFEANLNYYDRTYVSFSQYRRLSNVLSTYIPSSFDIEGNPAYDVSEAELQENGGILFNSDGSLYKAYSPKQEKFKGGFMLDLSIGKYIRLQRGRSLSVNLQLQNVTNNRNLRTGGYEQNRDDFYNSGEARAYQFSKNSKYYYANGFNFYLNVGFKF